MRWHDMTWSCDIIKWGYMYVHIIYIHIYIYESDNLEICTVSSLFGHVSIRSQTSLVSILSISFPSCETGAPPKKSSLCPRIIPTFSCFKTPLFTISDISWFQNILVISTAYPHGPWWMPPRHLSLAQFWGASGSNRCPPEPWLQLGISLGNFWETLCRWDVHGCTATPLEPHLSCFSSQEWRSLAMSDSKVFLGEVVEVKSWAVCSPDLSSESSVAAWRLHPESRG
jgi:hypothetical protein